METATRELVVEELAGLPEIGLFEVLDEAAVAGGAECIVSGDTDLLDVGECEGIPIISPREFLGSA